MRATGRSDKSKAVKQKQKEGKPILKEMEGKEGRHSVCDNASCI